MRYGSYAFGTEEPESDLDLRGISALSQPFPAATPWCGPGVTFPVFEIRSFVNHLCAGRNAFIEIPWTDPQDYLFISKAGHVLIENRGLFITQQIRETLLAHANVHLAYLRKSHELLSRPSDPDCVLWIKQRNPRRKELDERHGYDTKDAALIMRVLRHVREAFTEKRLWVRRPDAAELRALRHGSMSYDAFMAWAENEINILEQMQTTLPKRPNAGKVADLIEEMRRAYLDTPTMHTWFRNRGVLANCKVMHGIEPAPPIDPAIRSRYSWGQCR